MSSSWPGVTNKPEVRILADPAAVAQAAAEEFLRCAPKTVALAGGSTPRAMYALLAQQQGVAWDQIHFFWGDERHVPPDHDDSNYLMAHEALLSKIPAPPANIHRIRAEEEDPHLAAADYAREIQRHFAIPKGQWPRFDLVLLGMGPDGHTASLFPGSDALYEKSALVAASWVDKLHAFRLTMTIPLINNAATVIFAVTGGEKAATLRAVLRDDGQPQFPCQLIHPKDGRLLWLVDRAAARLL